MPNDVANSNMGKIKPFLHRFKWPLLIATLLIVGLWVSWQSFKYGNAVAAHAFTSYVSEEYMPAQRQLTKKWPTNLSGLPQYVKADKSYTASNERLNRILKYHQDTFEKLEILRSDSKSCTYRLYLKSNAPVCKSTVNPDDGNCKY